MGSQRFFLELQLLQDISGASGFMLAIILSACFIISGENMMTAPGAQGEQEGIDEMPAKSPNHLSPSVKKCELERILRQRICEMSRKQA